MQKKKLSQSGITLIALIITIIVMLILVAVTVKVAIDSGLFGHAKKAVDDWKAAEEQESNIGNGPVTIGGVTYNSLDEYLATLPKTPETPDTPTTPDRTGLSVGDYVAYTPDTVSNYTGLGSSETEKAGSTSNPADGIPQDTTLTWRILSINDDGFVDLVSAAPIATNVYFQGSLGYNNGVLLLNDLCKSQYSNSTLGVTARSIDLEDIENKFNYTQKDTFMAFHCGNTASSKLSSCEMKYQMIMARSLPIEVTNGTLEGDIIPGDITFFRLKSTADAKLRGYIAQGEVLPVATRSFGAIGIFAIPEMGRFYRHVLIEGNYPHHGAVAFGHFGKALYEVYKYIGVDV